MADKMNIGEVVEIVNQMLDDDRGRMNFYNEVDKAVNCVFTPDPAVAELPFIKGRQFSLPDISDARNAGVRVFTSLLPNITISPTSDNEGEYERTDKMEQAWKWEMERMNRPSNGKKGIHDQIVESAVSYHAVALQTEYLPYKFKGKTNDPRVKSILSRKSHQWTIHHPGTVHQISSDYGMEHVAKNAEYSAQKLIETFGKDNKGVIKLMEENRKATKADLMREGYMLVDFMNWTNRVQLAYKAGGRPSVSNIVFMNEPHGLPFIPWVLMDYGNPLWEAIIKSGHWNNIQHMKLIKFSKAVAMGAKPDFAIESPDGTMRGVWLDWKNPLNPMVVPPGTKIHDIRPNVLDQQFDAEYQEDRADVARSTVSRILQDPTPYLNSPFSTYNAATNSALGQLSPAKRVAEAVEAEAINQGFQWIKHSEIPFTAYRKNQGDSKVEGDTPYKRGEAIVITHKEPPSEAEFTAMSDAEKQVVSSTVYFSLDSLYINVELQSANVTDEQAKLNSFLLAKRELGMSQKEVWERMNWDGFDMNMSQSALETLFAGELNKLMQLKDQEAKEAIRQQVMQEVEAQQAEAAKVAQAQNPQNAINTMNAESQMASMQGADMRGGSMPAAMSAPNENRVSIRGVADNEQETP